MSVRGLATAEETLLRWRFRMPEETGRLHVLTRPAWDANTKRRIWTMNLMARGRPMGGGVEGAFKFFDVGRDWIVRGFAESEHMHRQWERTNA